MDSIHARFDIHPQALAWLDKREGNLGIIFIHLHTVGQAHSNKLVIIGVGFGIELLHSKLGKPATGR